MGHLSPLSLPPIRNRGFEPDDSHIHPADAEIPFDWILRDVTGRHGPYEFMLSEPTRPTTSS
jgi:hypothetical protein